MVGIGGGAVLMSEVLMNRRVPHQAGKFLPRSSPYKGTLLTRKRTPLGPYHRPVPRVSRGGAFSYGRGTPVRMLTKSQGAWFWACPVKLPLCSPHLTYRVTASPILYYSQA